MSSTLSLSARAEQAVSSAPLLLPRSNVFLPALAKVDDITPFPEIIPADWEMSDPAEYPLQPEPFAVVVNSLEKLSDLVDLYGQAARNQNLTPYMQESDTSIRHEKEHGEIDLLLGARAVEYGLLVVKIDLRSHGIGEIIAHQLFARAIGLRTTWLGRSLSFGYPIDPSPGDKNSLRKRGIRSVEELGQRIGPHNARSGTPFLPLPKSLAA